MTASQQPNQKPAKDFWNQTGKTGGTKGMELVAGIVFGAVIVGIVFGREIVWALSLAAYVIGTAVAPSLQPLSAWLVLPAGLWANISWFWGQTWQAWMFLAIGVGGPFLVLLGSVRYANNVEKKRDPLFF